MIHESGTAQLEINFNHGDPVHVSDQVLVFKRIVRQVALKHGVYATFMAKPMENQPGSAMHLHVSLVDAKKGNNLFGAQNGWRDGNTEMFRHFVGGLQKYLGDVHAAVRAERELVPPHAAGLLGADQSAMGLRQPLVRLARADLAYKRTGASKTACRAPTPIPISRSPPCWCAAISAFATRSRRPRWCRGAPTNGRAHLPRTLREGLDRFKKCQPVIESAGRAFLHRVPADQGRTSSAISKA